MIDIYKITQQWLFENLIDQSLIASPNKIHFSNDSGTFEDKPDYLMISFNTFDNICLNPEIETADTQRKITEEKTCILTIMYIGFNAFIKLNDIMDKIRSDDNAHKFLQSNHFSVEPINIIPVSDLIGDNLLESASMDCKMYFTSERVDNSISYVISNIDTSGFIIK